MSDTKATAIDRYLHNVRNNLSRYCVSISYVESGKLSPQDWKYGSGFLLKHNESTFVLTAGHLATEVHKLKMKGKLAGFHVRLHHISDELKTLSINIVAITTDSLVVAPDFDGAILRFPAEIAVVIESHGNKWFTAADFLKGQTTERHLAVLCGYPVQANIVTKNEEFITLQDGKWMQHNQRRLGSVAFQTTVVCEIGDKGHFIPAGYNCEVDEHVFRLSSGSINADPRSEVTSASGMSGGPIVAIVADGGKPGAFFQPHLIGMQIRQSYIERKNGIEITKLTAVSSTRLLAWITRTV